MVNSKERVYASIRRQSLDRVPCYFWFHPDILAEVGRRTGTAGFDIEVTLGNDVLQPWISINGSMARPAAEGETFTDDFGITWVRNGYYNSVIRHPLEHADEQTIRQYPMPEAQAPSRYAALEALLARHGEDHFIGADVSGSIFEPAYHLRNMEGLLVEMTIGAPEAEALLDKTMRFTAEAALECVRRGVDWIWLGDDVGTQSGMMFNPEVWRAMLKPRMKWIIEQIRAAKPDMIVAYHSCGSIHPIIGDLAEIGIDVLNPLQPMAAGMDNFAIKREFGDRLSFMCGMDTQEFLLQATPQQVRERTRRVIDVMGDGGGFIFAGSHTIQPDVPWANIEAMLEVVHED